MADQERERQIAAEAKRKLDKELELKDMHKKKREELLQREIDTCLTKLTEINNRLEKGNQKMSEKQEERKAYLKT